MGLMDLLTVGRSISSIDNRPNRYKMSARVYLPDFGNHKRPARAVHDSKQTVPALSCPSTENLELFREKQTAQKRNTEPREKLPMNAIAEPQTHAPEIGTRDAEPKHAFPKGRWTVFKNPFHGADQAVTEDEPVQSELSLETIKPIRNDLNEGDPGLFELSESPVNGRSASQESGRNQTKPGALWGKIARAVFGAKE